uniref:Uncharacterized protein n=1 Tax=Arundo donax TaxID=35708 RepID=A0A0A8XX78_ARUDO
MRASLKLISSSSNTSSCVLRDSKSCAVRCGADRPPTTERHCWGTFLWQRRSSAAEDQTAACGRSRRRRRRFLVGPPR